MFLLDHFLRQYVAIGRLTVVDSGGKTHIFAGREITAADDTATRATGEPLKAAITIRFHDRAIQRAIAFNPRLKFGEAIMDGRVTVEDGTIREGVDFMAANAAVAPTPAVASLAPLANQVLRRIHQFNPTPRARRNAAHHYNISGELYELFLDADRQYSCAYFDREDMSLEDAQLAKKRHLAGKLCLRPGMRVLDIGCGWGGLALYLADEAECEVRGITLASEQLKVARQRAEAARLGEQVDFALCDYREQTGRFDRIISVGMFEHVGVGHFRQYFEKVRDLLADDGVGVIHTIGRTDGPGATDPWIRRYIFPGGYIPALSEVLKAIERTGLIVTDVEVLRLHYAETLRHWQARFIANRDKAQALHDERFCRMWEYYLAASEAAFRHLNTVVHQIQVARNQAALPLVRDYITDWERHHADVSHRNQGGQRAA